MASIKKDKNGRWQARVSYKNKEGIFKTKSQRFRTKAEAQTFAGYYEIQEGKDELTEKVSPNFPDYFWEWFTTYKESSVRERTRLTYKQAYHVLKQYFSDTKINEIDRRKYQLFLKQYGENHAKSTVSKMNSLYHASVKDAIYDGYIKKDFVQGTSIVFNKANTRKIEYLNIRELKILIDYLYSTRNIHFTSKYMIITALLTGMRPGEVGGLKWENINFDFGTISVKQSWNEANKDFEPLKNESSYRIIRVDNWLLNLLKELPKNDEQHRVFANQYKTIPTSRAVNNVIQKSLAENSIQSRGFHFHSCRHTHVAYLLSKRIDLYAISKRLGHSNMMITSRVYAYLIDEYKAKTDKQIVNSLSDITPNSHQNNNDNKRDQTL